MIVKGDNMLKIWIIIYKICLRVEWKYLKFALLCLEAYIIHRHRLYDEVFYKGQREDLKSVKHGLLHYVRYGWKENLSPCILFDVSYYLEKDRNIKYNPLIHYLKYGEAEGRKPHPLFNPDYYRLRYNKKNNFLERYLNGAGNHYDDLLFPYSTFVNNTYIVDDDFISFKCRKDDVETINLFLNEGEIENALRLFYEIWNWRNNVNPIQVRFYKYKILQLREHGKSVYKISKEQQLDELKDMPGYNSKYQYPQAYINMYHDVQVIGGTNLVIKDDIIYNDELADFWDEDYGVKPWDVLDVKHNGNNELVGWIEKHILENNYDTIEKGILISCTYDNNYFHWMVESLPMVMYVLDYVKDYSEFPLLIPEKLHNNFKSAFNQLLSSYNNVKVLKLKKKCTYKVKELLIPSKLSRILDRYHGEMLLGIDTVINPLYVKRVSDAVKMKSHSNYRKIYLSRAGGNYRKLKNEQEVETFLVRNGFEVVDISKTSFEFQRELFAQADVVVAPTGATMTNILLSPAKSKFFVLYSNHPHLEPQFLGGKRCLLWDQLAQICGVDIMQINGERLYNRDDLHDDYIIPVELLRKELSEKKVI